MCWPPSPYARRCRFQIRGMTRCPALVASGTRDVHAEVCIRPCVSVRDALDTMAPDSTSIANTPLAHDLRDDPR